MQLQLVVGVQLQQMVVPQRLIKLNLLAVGKVVILTRLVVLVVLVVEVEFLLRDVRVVSEILHQYSHHKEIVVVVDSLLQDPLSLMVVAEEEVLGNQEEMQLPRVVTVALGLNILRLELVYFMLVVVVVAVEIHLLVGLVEAALVEMEHQF